MKSFTAEILEAEDGSGDGILQFPPEFCIQQDWREGDNIHMTVEDGALVLRNTSKEKRENLSDQAP